MKVLLRLKQTRAMVAFVAIRPVSYKAYALFNGSESFSEILRGRLDH